MQNSVLKNTGNSRYLRSSLPEGTTWEEALSMLRSATFPVDFAGLNADGWEIIGTPYNKSTTCTDDTAKYLGIYTGEPTIDMAFNQLRDARQLSRMTVLLKSTHYGYGNDAASGKCAFESVPIDVAGMCNAAKDRITIPRGCSKVLLWIWPSLADRDGLWGGTSATLYKNGASYKTLVLNANHSGQTKETLNLLVEDVIEGDYFEFYASGNQSKSEATVVFYSTVLVQPIVATCN